MSKKKEKVWLESREIVLISSIRGFPYIKMFFIKYHPNKRLRFRAWIQVKIIISSIKPNDRNKNIKYGKKPVKHILVSVA